MKERQPGQADIGLGQGEGLTHRGYARDGRAMGDHGSARPTEAPRDLSPGIWPLYCVATAFWYNRRFGAWFLLGLLLDVGFSRVFA